MTSFRETANMLGSSFTRRVAAPQSDLTVEKPVMDSLREMWTGFFGQLPNYALALALLVATWLIASLTARGLGFVLRRFRLRRSLQDLFRQLVYCALWLGGILVAAVIAFPGVTVAKLLTVLGLGSIAIGFAFKDIFENFFAGVLILWRFPFETGDFIETGEIFGRVEETTIRMTAIRQTDGQLVVLPNAHLFKNPVNVVTSRPRRRAIVMCGVAYDVDIPIAREVIRQAVESCETVATEDPVEVFAKSFGSSSIDFEIAWWTGSAPSDIRRSRDEVVSAVKRALDDADIEIPFPYRTLTFKEPIRTAAAES